MRAILEVLGESSVRAMIIALTTAGVLRVMRVASPRICHRAWTGVLMAMLCLPLLSLMAPRIDVPVLPSFSGPVVREMPSLVDAGRQRSPRSNIPVRETAAPDRAALPGSFTESRSTGRSVPATSVYEAAGILYLAGFSVLALRLLMGTLLARRLACGASRDGRIIYSAQCTVPITVGLFRARILLPAESSQWNRDKLEAVLIHEEEHVRRRDPLVEWLGLLNRSVYWFHPLSWWLSSRLSGLAEQACDEAVLARGHDSGRYAEQLLEFARSVKRRGVLIAAGGSSLHGSELAQRVRRIVSSGITPSISRVRLAVVSVLCGIAILAPAVSELTDAHEAAAPLAMPAAPLPIKSIPKASAAAFFSGGVPVESSAAVNLRITVAYSGNILGYLDPCGCADADGEFGGLYKKAAYLDQYRKDHGALITVDSGDLLNEDQVIPESLIGLARQKADLMARILGQTGIDAVNIGELDLALGVGYLKELEGRHDFPFVSANLVDAQNTPVFTRYVIKRVNDKRVGIFGVIGDTAGIAEKVNLITNGALTVLDPIQAAQSVVSELSGKVDYVIALTHQGTNRDWVLARRVPGIGLVIGGHDRQKTEEPNVAERTFIVQAGEKNQHQGMIEVMIDGTNTAHNTLVPYGDEIPNDLRVKRLVDDHNDKVIAFYKAQDGTKR